MTTLATSHNSTQAQSAGISPQGVCLNLRLAPRVLGAEVTGRALHQTG